MVLSCSGNEAPHDRLSSSSQVSRNRGKNSLNSRTSALSRLWCDKKIRMESSLQCYVPAEFTFRADTSSLHVSQILRLRRLFVRLSWLKESETTKPPVNPLLEV